MMEVPQILINRTDGLGVLLMLPTDLLRTSQAIPQSTTAQYVCGIFISQLAAEAPR